MRLKTLKNTTDHDVSIWELQGKRVVLPPGCTVENINVTNPECLGGCTFTHDLTEVQHGTSKKLLHD